MLEKAFQGCVVIPTYNSGSQLLSTVNAVACFAERIIVSVDGSTDGSEEAVTALAREQHALHVLRSPSNEGKGAATVRAFEFARGLGYTHAAVFDADGQHAAVDLPKFLDAAERNPGTMVLGVPVFGSDAPRVRVWGRRLGNWFTNLETFWGGIGDSLFGFRVYPIGKSLEVLHGIRGAKGFDFDTQLVVRLFWAGVVPLNLPTQVRYPSKKEGGVSHFQYVRDNWLLARVHAGLLLRACGRVPDLLDMRRRSSPADRATDFSPAQQ